MTRNELPHWRVPREYLHVRHSHSPHSTDEDVAQSNRFTRQFTLNLLFIKLKLQIITHPENVLNYNESYNGMLFLNLFIAVRAFQLIRALNSMLNAYDGTPVQFRFID